IAGLYGFTWGWMLEVKFVWVREDLRGRGHGRRMLEAAEAEARKRGCEHVWLDSYTFQAPTFYRQFGYQVFGSLDGFPPPQTGVSDQGPVKAGSANPANRHLSCGGPGSRGDQSVSGSKINRWVAQITGSAFCWIGLHIVRTDRLLESAE